VQSIMKMQLLGDKLDPVQWECPTQDDGQMVHAITIDNNQARIIVENIKLLVNLSFSDDSRKQIYCIVFANKFGNANDEVKRGVQ
jgi:hypothetical protein